MARFAWRCQRAGVEFEGAYDVARANPENVERIRVAVLAAAEAHERVCGCKVDYRSDRYIQGP